MADCSGSGPERRMLSLLTWLLFRVNMSLVTGPDARIQPRFSSTELSVTCLSVCLSATVRIRHGSFLNLPDVCVKPQTRKGSYSFIITCLTILANNHFLQQSSCSLQRIFIHHCCMQTIEFVINKFRTNSPTL